MIRHAPLPRRRTAAAVLVAGATLVAGAIAGCGVPLDDSPRAINRATTTTTSAGATSVTEPITSSDHVELFFVDEDGGLQGRTTRVQMEATVETAVSALLTSDPKAPLVTRIPDGTALLSVDLDEGRADIDLSGTINDYSDDIQKIAFAQIVFTALAFDEVDEVSFRIDGTAVEALTDRGARRAVVAADYDPPLNPG